MNVSDTVNRFEKAIYVALMAILIIVLVVSLVDLVSTVYNGLVTLSYPSKAGLLPQSLDADEFIAILGGFLLVLIGVELLDTIKAYFTENSIHVEIVILLAIIAAARKVLLLNTGNSSLEFDLELIGIGILIAGLGAGYYLVKKAGVTIGPRENPPD
jgi:uncharacterized membrane protein (DUF373 family)